MPLVRCHQSDRRQSGCAYPHRIGQDRAGQPVDSRRGVRRRDVLITRANTPERVGATCLVPEGAREGLFLCDKTLRIVPEVSSIEPAYLAAVMNTPVVHEQLTASATGTSASMFNISQKSIRNTEIPFPDLSRQREIAAMFS